MKNGKLRVALVGVSFGAEFVPIYLKHPDVDSLVLVDTDRTQLNKIGDKFLLKERLTDFDAMLADETIDAVHLVTPPATHAPLSVKALNAGKHCACTIPMGMSIDELYQVIEARKKSGKHYMFMETSVYGREFLYVKDLYENGGAGQDPVHALRPLPGHGGMARLLAGLPSPNAPHPRGGPLPDAAGKAPRERVLQGFRQGAQRGGRALWLPLRL